MVDLGMFNSLTASIFDTFGLQTNSAAILLTSFVLVDGRPDRVRSAIVTRFLNDCGYDFREFALGAGIPYFSIYHLLTAVTERILMSFSMNSAFFVIE